MSDCVRKVSYVVRKVLIGVKKVSYGVRKVSDGVRKVSDGVRKVSCIVRKVFKWFHIGVRWILGRYHMVSGRCQRCQKVVSCSYKCTVWCLEGVRCCQIGV